jgi:hypothetical protein
MHIKRAVTERVELELLQPGQRTKTAAAMPEVQAFLSRLKPEQAYTYALVNAMGYSEYYGTNSNADWYGYCPELNFNGLLHAWPDIGQNLETDRMKGRDWPYGYPCFYGASVYAHHKNTDPVQLGFGDVVYAYANPIMKRIELVMRIHNEEARKKGHLNIVERIHAGERCDVSMGAKIPWDACSKCTDWEAVQRAWKLFDPMRHKHWGMAVLEEHKKRPIRGIAVTAVEYCPCLRSQKNQVMPDGRKVFMYNIFPRFFDISCVFIGADRTARVMWHMAPSFRDDAPIPQPTDGLRAARMTLEHFLSLGKVASKRAELEKEIPDGVIEKVLSDSDSAPEVRFDLAHQDPKRLLSSAAALGILLSPREFDRLLGGPGEGFATGGSGIANDLAVGPRFVDSDLLRALTALAPERSAFRPFVEPRITEITAHIAVHHAPENPEPRKIAALYNGYRLSVLEQGEKLAERARGHLVDDPLELQEGRPALGALLLGVAPMVHLLAAHLRQRHDEEQRLGDMATFLAEHADFELLAALAASVRIAMIKKACGLLPAALSLLGNGTKA